VAQGTVRAFAIIEQLAALQLFQPLLLVEFPEGVDERVHLAGDDLVIRSWGAIGWPCDDRSAMRRP
jgi:hypothetical protein